MEMAFRAEKRAIRFIGALLLAPALLAQQSFQYEVWRGHSRIYTMPPRVRKAGDAGTLTITDIGVTFQKKYKDGKTPKNPLAWHWDYQDIQQLKISPTSLTVLSYDDNNWKFGADRQYKFDLVSGGSFENSYRVLKTRLDQRFVAVVADRPSVMLWEIPVKRLVGWGGDEGVLQVGASQIVYKSANPEATRTWRDEDIDNISRSGPFELTITTFERAKLDYGSRKQFNFRLKQPLEEARYEDLWLRLNQSKGLKVLSSYREAGAASRQ
jgi:hypothetical protein